MKKSMKELVNNSRVIFYFSQINSIGGVESFFWYLAQTYRNIEVYYKTADPKQIERLTKIIRTHKYTGGSIVCDKFFCQYNVDILDNVVANDIFYIIHCDHKAVGFKPIIHPKINHYIGVSKLACDSFEELSGIKPELIYNPIVIDKEAKKPLLIVSATRLTREKGKENIIKIADKLDQEGLKYLWLIFTNDTKEIQNPNIIYASPRLDIAPYLKMADIVAQLSSTESYGYTPNEALLLGKPVLLMDLPIWKELGIKDGIHGWIIDDIDKFDVHKLYEPIKPFKYDIPKSNWGKYLNNKTTYDPNQKVKVKAKLSYYDIEQNKQMQVSEIFETSINRAVYLEELRLVERI